MDVGMNAGQWKRRLRQRESCRAMMVNSFRIIGGRRELGAICALLWPTGCQHCRRPVAIDMQHAPDRAEHSPKRHRLS